MVSFASMGFFTAIIVHTAELKITCGLSVIVQYDSLCE